MRQMILGIFSIAILISSISIYGGDAPQPLDPIPSQAQLDWQRLEYIAFAHFGINTFTGREWGEGTEDEKLFNPTDLDANQWVKAIKDAGMKMLILTAKHHDGFCLWPSQYTEHSVKNSPWREGKGDVVREVANACRNAGIKLGIYCSPWDRHEKSYGDSPVYNQHFRNQLTELLSNYGDVTEVWFDGACGEGPNGKKQVYDWDSYYAVIRALQPNALIFGCGPDIRWVGNESGVARETEWSALPVTQDILDEDWLAHQQTFVNGTGVKDAQENAESSVERKMMWYPAECDVSIRPGWFYHAEEDSKVKSLEDLLDIYYKSVGRNGVLLLNLPPDQRGRIHENDVNRLLELRKVLDETFKTDFAKGKKATATSVWKNQSLYGAEQALDGDRETFWAAEDGVVSASLEIDLGESVTFDRSMIQEHIALGQRVYSYSIEAWDGQDWKEIVRGTTVGYKKLDRFSPVTAEKVRLNIQKSRACPTIETFALYKSPTQ